MKRCLMLALAASLLTVLGAHAQKTDWPTKPVRFIVPFPPGGTVDPLARLLGARLSAALGQQFIVDNRPGASGSLGTGIAAKANPDGYIFLFVFDTHAVNPALIPGLPFNTLTDLAPVMLVGTAPMAVVTNPGKPYKTFADVVKAAKAKPDSISYGTIGSGSLGHLTITFLQQQGGFRMIHVPYKGGGPMSADALGGQIETAIGSVPLLAPQVRSGKLRGLVVTGDKRSHALPDVPSLAEQGFPGFSALAWWGIFAPAATPKAIMDRFHGELVKALAQPEVRKQLTEQLGMELVVSTPAELQKFATAEVQRWGKVVKDHNIRPE